MLLNLLLLALVALILPVDYEGSIKASLSRTVALGRTWSGLQFVAFAIPYRPNRFYYRLAVARI